MSTAISLRVLYSQIVAIILCLSFAYANTIQLEAKPRNLAIDPQHNLAIVPSEGTNSASVFDLALLKEISRFSVGRMPRGVAVSRDLNIAMVSNNQGGTVSVIDLSSLMPFKTIAVGRGPEGIALDAVSGLALVSNRTDNTVSVIDLSAYTEVAVISVGRSPIDVAIDSELSLAIVVNQLDWSLSVIDLNAYAILKTIATGKKPLAIDISPQTHTAVIATEKDNAVMVIDLLSWNMKTIPTGKHPIDLAINVLDNRALVICDEDRSLLLIDLNTYVIVQEYALNKRPVGVAVNNLTNIAGVVDDYANSLTLLQLPNPIPVVKSLSSVFGFRGSAGETITIAGERFIKSSKAYLENQQLETRFINNHQLEITIPKEIFAISGIYKIKVANPGPAGGISNAVEFTVKNPFPSISAMMPTEAMAGTAGITLDVYGTGFFVDTAIYMNDTARQPVFVSRNKLEVALTTEDLKQSGIISIKAFNSAPGGGFSNTAPFTVKPPLEINITSPADGETLNKAKTIVKGTIKSDTKDIGIKVNGILAEIQGNEWIANNIPLSVGTNTITATATDSYGNTDTKSITVNANDTAQQVALSANITSGIAPLTTYFAVSTSFTPVSYQMDFEGDGIVDYTGTAFENINHTYTTEGIFYPTLTVIDNQGNTYSDTIAITVLNKAEIDALLKGKWEGMKGELLNKNIEKGIGYFNESSRENYRQAFNIIIDELPQIIAQMQDIEMIYQMDGIAKYRISRVQNIEGILQTITYYIYLVKGADGIWKIDKF